jgi:hypothetical protein
MKCPHCLTAFHSSPKDIGDGMDDYYVWMFRWEVCPACKKGIATMSGDPRARGVEKPHYLVYPRGIARAPLSLDVPEEFAADYREACLVLSDSPKASAALGRRCLQHILREKAGINKRNLADQIDEVIPSLPTHMQGMIDAVRVIGNFAAHPMKSTNTGEVLDVEPGEAEWLLDTLEALFDFYFVKPAEIARKRAAINSKLAEAGKPPLK